MSDTYVASKKGVLKGTRIGSDDPTDDMTTDELMKHMADAERGKRKLGASAYSLTSANKQLTVLSRRLGSASVAKLPVYQTQNNMTAYERNHYEMERYAPIYPLSRNSGGRHLNMLSSTGKTLAESTNRKRRGNKKVVRKRRRKKKPKK